MTLDTRMWALDLLTCNGSRPEPAANDWRAREVLGTSGNEPLARSSKATVLSVLSARAVGAAPAMYAAWPGLDNPVLVASVREPSDKLVWFGTSARRRLVRHTLRIGATGERFWMSSGLPAIARTWAEFTGTRTAGVSISNGTAGANRRPIAVVLDARGEAVAFARCAHLPTEVDALQQEANLLLRLRESAELRELVPEVLQPAPVGQAVVMYMTGRQGLVRGPRTLDRRHAEFARALSMVDRQVLDVSGCSAVCNAHETMGLGGLDEGDRRVGERLLEAVGTGSVLTCRQHRDFVPWNTSVTRERRLYFYDWEYSQAGHPVAHDLIHFACMPSVLRGLRPDKVRELARHAWALSPTEGRGDFELCFGLWTLDLWALYASAWTRNPVGSRTVLNWLARLANDQRGLK